jgi:DNA-binding NtrC family response regulator
MSMPPAFALVVLSGQGDRVFAGSILMMAGLRVRVTGNFRRARAVMRVSPPSVLVTEARRGGTKGLDLARLGRSLRPHMTQLMTVDSDDLELRREIKALGAGLVRTPATEDRLLAALYRTALREPNADGTVALDCQQPARENAHRRISFPLTPPSSDLIS